MKIKRSAIIFSIIMSVSILVYSFSVQADEKEYFNSEAGGVSKLNDIIVEKSNEMELLKSSDGAVAIANTGGWTPKLAAVTMKLNGTEITENQEISGKDELELDMEFDINLSFTDPNQKAIIAAGGPYVLTTLPNSLASALNSPLDVSVQIDEKQIKIGTLIRDGKNIKFQFEEAGKLEEEIRNTGRDGIGSVSTVFLVSLDMDKIGKDESAAIIFATASQSTTYNVKVKENMPNEPKIEKEGHLNDDGTIEWTVKVTMGGKKYNAQNGSMPAFVLKDKLGSNQSYVANSFKINGVSVNDQGVTCSRNDTTHEQTICYEYIPDDTVNNKGTEITYTYQTKINPSAYVNDENQLINGGKQESKINNEAQLLADGNPITSTATAEVPYNMAENWMTKTAKPVSGAGVGEVEWEITINANGYTLESVTLHDQLDAVLQLNGDITVTYQKADGTTTLEVIPGSEFQNGFLGGDAGHKFGDLTDVNKITVTYHTVFESQEKFDEYNRGNSDPENKAWAEWEWKDYWGPGTGPEKVGIPELSKPTGLFKGIISKSGKYDSTTHEITWTIIINENNVTINKPVIEDDIKAHQEYVPGSVTVINGSGTLREITGNTKGTIIFQYDAAISSKQTIQFKTKIDEKSFYADNSTESSTFWNNARLFDDKTLMAKCDAAVQGKSEVITKEAGEYDYANKKFAWTIVVNQNKAEMKDIVVIDQLPKGVTLDEVSVQYQISGGSRSTGPVKLTATGNAPGYSYEKENGIFNLYLPDMNAGDGQVTVTYTTSVDVDKITEFGTSTSDVEITNSAILRNNYGYQDVTVSATRKIPSNILLKTGEIPSDDKRCIEYTVKINGSRVALPEGTLIKDTLPAGLQLKLDSVRLYEAAVDSKGEFTQGTKVDSTKYKISTASLDDQKIEFSLMLPDDCENKAYILKYRTFIIDENKAPFTNIVTMNQLKLGDNKSYNMDKQYVSRNYASGTLFSSTSPHLEIVLTDADNPDKKIEGAVYELIENGNVISQGVTDKDGKVTFYGVDEGEDYTIRQKTTSDGYELPSNPDTIITIKAGKNTVLLTNKKPQKIPEKGENAGGNGDGDHSKNDAGGNHDSANENKVNENKVNEMKPQSAPNQMQYSEEQAAGKMLPETGGFWGTGIIYLIGTGSVILGLILAFFMRKRSTVFKLAGYMIGVAGAALILITLCSNLYSLMIKQQEIANFERPDLIVEPIDVEDVMLKDEADSGVDYDVQIENLSDENGVMAVLSIPSISCKEIIREGSEKGTLAKALGHMEGTALPGQTGNCAIAGHRNYNFGMYFNRLDEVEVDDEIIVTTKTDSYIYRVTEIKVVEPEDLSVLEPADDTRITLITCTPLYVATHRLIVIGKLV